MNKKVPAKLSETKVTDIQLKKENEFVCKLMSIPPSEITFKMTHIKSMNDIISSCTRSETPSIAKMKKHLGEQKIIAYIGIWIMDLNLSLGVKNKMNEHQIKECAFFIIEEHYYLTIADFKLFFTDVKKGKFGKMYESLSTPKILEWLKMYVIDRTNTFERTDESQRVIERKREHNLPRGSIQAIQQKLDIIKNVNQ